MTARVWTREELDRVHPLPDGWVWVPDGSMPSACWGYLEVSADATEVWGGGSESPMSALPIDVALAVILASKGLDSLAAMAAHLEAPGSSNRYEVADMLRRGTVEAQP